MKDIALEAVKFLSELPQGISAPNVSLREGEISFEWKIGTRHAVMSICTDGVVGYAMETEGKFLPGATALSSLSFPIDLEEYLTSNLAEPGERRLRDDLVNKLVPLTVGSCSCMTITPELSQHGSDCRYRLAGEALELVASLAAPR